MQEMFLWESRGFFKEYEEKIKIWMGNSTKNSQKKAGKHERITSKNDKTKVKPSNMLGKKEKEA